MFSILLTYTSFIQLEFMKINVGIFFGGPSREREISFAGGRTVYDNLNQALFQPVPIFVDSFRNWVLLDWHYIYKGSIRDFYPPVSALPESANDFQVYVESIQQMDAAAQQELLKEIGKPMSKAELSQYVDVAFLALHGEYGEDGQLQQELEALNIPYTGCGIAASQLGMDKALQKEVMLDKGFACPTVEVLTKQDWLSADVHGLYQQSAQNIGFPLVIRPANQGSSIGVSIIAESEGLEGFEAAINRAFFRELIALEEWNDRSEFERIEYVKVLADIRDGLGFPISISLGAKQKEVIHPEELLQFLNTETANAEHLSQVFVLEGAQTETKVILESFIEGQEFSCIVIRTEDNSIVALPPTEIIKGGEVFDYRSKYMPGLSRKETPIQLPDASIEAIRRECESLFNQLDFQVYARIDGFYTPTGQIYLNDPNTTSGMLPSSFFFHQAAEIGLNPSQFLTYIIRISLQERLAQFPEQTQWRELMQRLDQALEALQNDGQARKRIGVVLGGYSFERHISVESGRNIFEKLSSAVNYEPIPIFLTGSDQKHELYQLPINLLLKDNADDIKDKISAWKSHPLLEKIRRECHPITQKYAAANVVFEPQPLNYDNLANKVDGVFVALHGRPGEDGQIQMQLDARRIPYNGSGVKSSSITIDKYQTLQTLAKHGLKVTEQLLLSKGDFKIEEENFYNQVEKKLTYPFIAKPVDDGCSSAVKVIKSRADLESYTRLIFGVELNNERNYRRQLKLSSKEEFPSKSEILFEQMISKEDGIHFLEITGGMLTSYSDKGTVQYQVFEPSETLASGEVLSLEEKFLAGEGQNLTPARLAVAGFSYEHIVQQVQETLKRAAKILQVEGYCRIDAFVRVLPNGKAETQVIEVNSLPGMTPATAIFHQAALANYKPAAFIDKILDFGFQRTQKAGLPPIVSKKEEPALKPKPKQEKTTPVVATAIKAAKETIVKASAAVASTASNVIPEKKSFKSAKGQTLKTLMQSKYFYKNLAAMLALVVVCFLLLNLFLSTYTGHGKSVQVENYTGLSIEAAKTKAQSRGFNISMNEAPYSMDITAGEVIDQEPEALSRIKKNRTIYLTVIGGPKSVAIPSFTDATDDYMLYARMLKSLQIKSLVKEEVFDAKLDGGTILHFMHNGKKYTPNDVKRGVKILQGSTLEFVVTKSTDDNVRLPSLICKRFSEVRFLLPSLGLEVGTIEGNVANRSEAYVFKQEPDYKPGEKILLGSSINVHLQASLPAGCPAEVSINTQTDTTKATAPPVPSPVPHSSTTGDTSSINQ